MRGILDGAPAEQRSDVDALRRSYETADGSLCITAAGDEGWEALCIGLGADGLAADPRFADERSRRANDEALADELRFILAGAPATHWARRLHAVGVSCRVTAPAT
jgi:crotonobetainyl-CoA:carnitine CoA-transferase CaiB-like acyl-CoA transferase